MALTNQQISHIRKKMSLADTLIELQHQIQLHRAEWDQNDVFNQVTTPELLENPEFEHLEAADLGNAQNALDAVVTALGDYSSGQAVNLIKMKG